MKKKRYSRILAYTLCLSLLATGCGKSAEDVTDYGSKQTEAENGSTAAKTGADTEAQPKTEAGSESTKKAAGAKNGHTLADQLGGTDLSYEQSFPIGNITGKISAKVRLLDYMSVASEEIEEYEQTAMEGLAMGESLLYDTETLPSYRVQEMSADKVYEQEIVKNILGDTATEVHRNISVKNGDAQYAVSAAQDTYNLYVMSDDADPDSQPEEFSSWDENDLYTLHTYEGTFNGIETQLVINYRKDKKSKVITFGPKNWADAVSTPGYNEYSTANDGKVLLPSKDKDDTFEPQSIETFFPDLTNQAGSDLGAMRSDAQKFAEEKLLLKLPESAFLDDRIYGRKPTQILSYPEGELDKADPKDVILDGYDIVLAQGIGRQSYYMDPEITDVARENFGSVYVTKKGIVAGDFHITYDFEERLSDQVAILPFDTAMEALQEGISSKLDTSKISGTEAVFQEADLVYYPIPSPDKEGEYTFIPVWVLSIYSNQYHCAGHVVMNAMDGTILEVTYTE